MAERYAGCVVCNGPISVMLVVAFWILLGTAVVRGIRRGFPAYSTLVGVAWIVNCFLFLLPAITIRAEINARVPDVARVAMSLVAMSQFLSQHLLGTAVATLVVILSKPRRNARTRAMLLLCLAVAAWIAARFVSVTVSDWRERGLDWYVTPGVAVEATPGVESPKGSGAVAPTNAAGGVLPVPPGEFVGPPEPDRDAM